MVTAMLIYTNWIEGHITVRITVRQGVTVEGKIPLYHASLVNRKIRFGFFGNFPGFGSFQEPENPKTELGKGKLRPSQSSWS
jgi:hypothetical protein